MFGARATFGVVDKANRFWRAGARAIVWMLYATFALTPLACGGGHMLVPDGGVVPIMIDGGHDAPVSTDHATDGGAPSTCGDAGGSKRAAGQPCGCSADCSSSFCVDGFCCNEACQGGCRTCGEPGSEGTCLARTSGDKPRGTGDCATSLPANCGTDGKCDGLGACRKYVPGTQCKAGMCNGDAVVGGYVCDGLGSCRPGPVIICAPFGCNTSSNACFTSCSSSADCVSTNGCDETGSCGKRNRGATCRADADCLSGFCADSVCCNSSCNGPCVSCALPSRLGTCWPIDTGGYDPHAICKDTGAKSCGQMGACDGVGGCAQYPRDTQCTTPVCSGNRLNTPGTCNGLGTCQAPGLQSCSPFQCVNASCTSVCKVDADCDTGNFCVNGSCGPKQNGQSCAKAAECKSGQCVDGVCCESACAGACRSCALPSAPGKCTMVASGNADSRASCKDAGAASCANNGKCDGVGGCQLYPKMTTCAAETCASNVYTPPATCDGAGRCITPDTLACSPYVCNGGKCFTSCSADTQCLTGNRCTSNSCGKVNQGASCSSNAECKSAFCAQGVCCDKACTGSCQSCALSATLGTCTNVPTGNSDPAGVCKDAGAAGCGTNGKCAAGACQKYASGTSCKAATCPAGTTNSTAAASCDGAGACVTPATRSCFPYLCGTNACKAACTANADCSPPAVCNAGSCGLKDPGRTCADGSECKSTFCKQGVCCATDCAGACKSCNVSATTAGTCSNVAVAGSDPQGICKDMGAASCGTNGVCDGAGACQRYAAGTTCVSASCPTGMATQTNARVCDGAGACKTATTTACAPYVCNGSTACKSTCTVDTDCQSGSGIICDPKTNLCGNKKRQGQTCTASTDCLTGLTCVDGTCCGTASCPLCKACNVTASPGTCTNLAAGVAEPRALCPASTSAPCGNTGACNGAGACQQAATSVTCAAASCSGSSLTPALHCNGSGTCATLTSTSCTPYVCGTGACKSSCTADTDCVSPFTCQGSGTTKSCTQKANGLTCSANNQCISGTCVDGVCCGSASCPACQACNINGAGSCANMTSGATDTRCGASTTAACGKTNVCDGGACRNSTAVCAPASCSGSSFLAAVSCSGATATCPVQTPVSCGTYACTTAGCKTTCTSNTDCGSGSGCETSTGHCISQGGLGNACGSDAACSQGRCVDGVCCNTTATTCGRCQACNLTASKGTCTFVGTGAVEPHGMCAASSSAICGNTGTCAADQSCAQAPTSTMCGAPACSSGTETRAAFCNGAGACTPAVVRACDPYICGMGACVAGCASNAECIAGDYCNASGACVVKQMPGGSCSATAQCASGVCGAEGVCCDTACSGLCVSCTISTSPGACKPIMIGTACGPTACSADGRYFSGNACDGAGTCVTVDPSSPVDCVGTYGLTCSLTQSCI